MRLVLPDGVDGDDLTRIVEGVTLARDLINTPSNDMGPAELEEAARALAKQHGATVQGHQRRRARERISRWLHAVGAGSARAPRLIDITWGKDGDPKITLVGKGVCFDTGGLDIKTDTGMLNMKKDMAGGATALALAHMIMARKLKVRLRVIIPAVENSISGTSFRPRDIYTSRKGISVEIGNTDAEGRLVLADALTLADEDKPALIVDFATLTGAARVALGPDVPPVFTDDDALAAELARTRRAENDPLWRMPLWRPYEAMLDSKVADTNNVSTGGQGGAITAALFLRKFVTAKSWLHLDIFAWTPAAKPGRPEGAELQSARALYALLCAPLLLKQWSRSTPASIRSAPRSRRNICKARSRPRVSSRARATRWSSRSRPAPHAVARGAARHPGAAGRARRSSTRRPTRAGPGASSRPTAMSAGCRRMRSATPAGRRPTRSRCRARSAFPGRTSSCRRRWRCRWARGSPSRGRTSVSPSPPTAGICPPCIWRRSRRRQPDFVAVAEEFLHAPYLWGGKTSLGIDCSGLVQVALQAAGIACPRDSDMQELALGKLSSLGELRRGDLVFWKGHVAIARDGETLLHANAHHMTVAIEPAAEAIARIKAAGSDVTSVKRL